MILALFCSILLVVSRQVIRKGQLPLGLHTHTYLHIVHTGTYKTATASKCPSNSNDKRLVEKISQGALVGLKIRGLRFGKTTNE